MSQLGSHPMVIGLRVLESSQIDIYLSPIFETIVRGHRIAGVRNCSVGWTLGT